VVDYHFSTVKIYVSPWMWLAVNGCISAVVQVPICVTIYDSAGSWAAVAFWAELQLFGDIQYSTQGAVPAVVYWKRQFQYVTLSVPRPKRPSRYFVGGQRLPSCLHSSTSLA
jgi:hypothetical protein